jgi:hypothetical protein
VPLLQDFSVAAGDSATITFDLTEVTGITDLADYMILWDAYIQSAGVPAASIAAVISKSSESGQGITILESPPLTCVLDLGGADTVNLIGNYYHELSIFDQSNNKITPTNGIMTVLSTENR